MAIQGTTKKVNYLKIDKDGYFYISHKEPVEGAIEVKLKTGGTVYHTRYIATEYGKVLGLTIKEVSFNNIKTKVLNIKIEADNKNEIDSVDMPLYGFGNSLNPYVRGLALSLDKVTVDQKISLSCSRAKNSKGYTKKALYIFTDEERKDYINAYEGHELPQVKQVEKLGTITYDSSELDNYIYSILQNQLTKYSGNVESRVEKASTTSSTPKSTTPTPTPTPAAKTTKAEKPKVVSSPMPFEIEEDTDDLPF